MTSSTLPALQELDAIRLDRDWTWAELAESMGRAGVPMAPRTLHYLVKGGPRNQHPHDRTLHKIGVYLTYMREQARRARARKAQSARAAAVAR